MGAAAGRLRDTRSPCACAGACRACTHPPLLPLPALCALQVGQRGYYATRQLINAGFDAINISGGWKSFQDFKKAGMLVGGTAKL